MAVYFHWIFGNILANFQLLANSIFCPVIEVSDDKFFLGKETCWKAVMPGFKQRDFKNLSWFEKTLKIVDNADKQTEIDSQRISH